MTETERIWTQIKLAAHSLADKKRTLNARSAEEIVWKIILDEHAERPPSEALRYLANELRSLIAQYRREGSLTHDARRN